MDRLLLVAFTVVANAMMRHVQKPVVDHRAEVKIEFRGPSDLQEEEIAKIMRGWTYWDGGEDAPFLDFVTDDHCNIVLGKLDIVGVKPRQGYDSWCGKDKYQRLAKKWVKDSEKQTGQEVGDLVPPPVVVVGNMIIFEENWEGGPDVNHGKPVKEDVVMTLNAEHKVTNIVYGLDSLRGVQHADVEPHEAEKADDFQIQYLGPSELDESELKKIIHGWTYWGSGKSQPFLDFVSDDMCNVVLGPLKVGGVDFHGDVTSWCGRKKYEELAARWVAASEADQGKELGDQVPPPVKVLKNMMVFEEDWKGGPEINDGQPVRESVAMIIDPETHLVSNVIYAVDKTSIAR